MTPPIRRAKPRPTGLLVSLLMVAPLVPAVPGAPDHQPSPRLSSSTVLAAPSGAPSGGPLGGPVFGWPLDPSPLVVRPFAPPPRPWLPGHRGVDLAGGIDMPVRSAGPGVVRFAGTIAGRGVLSVEHRGGLRTTYEPVIARVRAGQRLAAGAVIGILAAGHPGCPVAACLHWGLRHGTQYLDPLALLGRARLRLLPTGPRGPAVSDPAVPGPVLGGADAVAWPTARVAAWPTARVAAWPSRR